MKRQIGFTLNEMLVVIIMVLGTLGWIMNIYFLYIATTIENWPVVILRGFGVIIFPLGSVLGFIPL